MVFQDLPFAFCGVQEMWSSRKFLSSWPNSHPAPRGDASSRKQGTESIAVTHQCPALSPAAQENAEIRPMEVVQGQASALQGKPKEMQLILLLQEKELSTAIAKQENSKGFLPQWRQNFYQLVKMCEDPAAVIQPRARSSPCKFLLPGSLLTVSGALKDFLAQKSTWEYWMF